MKSIIEEEDVEDKLCVSTSKEVSGSNVGSPDTRKSLVVQIYAMRCLKLTRKRIAQAESWRGRNCVFRRKHGEITYPVWWPTKN
jgi:hypothetical protein